FYYFDDAYDCCQPDDPMLRGAGVVSVPASSAVFASAPRQDSMFLQFDGDLGGTLGPLGLLGLELPAGGSRLRYPDNWVGGTPDGNLALWGDSTWYLADLSPAVDLPVSAHPETQASRLFLNALFSTTWNPPSATPELGVELVMTDQGCFTQPGPDDLEYEIRFHSTSAVPVHEAVLTITLPEGVAVASCEGEPLQEGAELSWTLSEMPPNQVLGCVFMIPSANLYWFEVSLHTVYDRFAPVPVDWSGVVELEQAVILDSDDDGVCDNADPEPFIPSICGDQDGDHMDDCWTNDDNLDNDCESGDEYPYSRKAPSDCSCTTGSRADEHGPWLAALLLLALLALRRRKANRGKTLR
ncbi:MYXO-CTERM sorting domain-containing protein, partial [Myxococcota bacterium]|nr:MYXO-CTERM sorting domain-containing protein [Myxococcota bacterium]